MWVMTGSMLRFYSCRHHMPQLLLVLTPTDISLMCRVQILITGHSLGGALATLAAYDIETAAAAQSPIRVHCMVYSFGAPRVGNHAFARDYRRVVGPGAGAVVVHELAFAWLVLPRAGEPGCV